MTERDDALLAGIRVLGDPVLRRVSKAVCDFEASAFRDAVERAHATLQAFRRRVGFGRAIAAPQVGTPARFIACQLDDRALTLVNPRLTWRSTERRTLWDDCMSFPDLLVRVERHLSVSVRWSDLEGREHHWEGLEPGLSELLQHEVDHLDGTLAIDRAVDRAALVHRREFERHRARFDALVTEA